MDVQPRAGRTNRLAGSLVIGGFVLAGAGLAGLDGFVARSLGPARPEPGWLDQVVGLLDLIAGRDVSSFLLGLLILIAGLALGLLGRRRLAGAWLFVGLVQLGATCAAEFSKPLFGRPRPFQALQDGGWEDRWFLGPPFDSFPSGHVAFYLGLVLPIVLLLPRWGLVLLIVPLLVAVQRVASLAHYPSDVAASIALAASLAWLLNNRRRSLAPPRGAGL